MKMKYNKILSVIVIGLLLLVLLTMNITNVISITENARFNMALSDIFVVFIVLIALYTIVRGNKEIVLKGLPIWIGLLSWIVIVGIINLNSSSINSGGLIGIFEELIKTGLCVIYFILGYNYLSIVKFSAFKKTWSVATVIFVFGGIIIYVLASKGVFYWSNDTKYHQMFMGTDTDPNHAATYLTLTFFAFGFFALSEIDRKKSVYCGLIMAFSMLGIILTSSRGGLAGFFVGLIILFIYYLRKNKRLAVSLVLLFCVVALLFVQTDLSFNEGYLTQRILYKIVSIDKGLDIRGSLSSTALLMGNDHPIFGVGRGNFKLNSAPYFDALDMTFIDDIPHNTFLGLYSEVGIFGLLLFLMPLWYILGASIKRYSKDKEKFIQDAEPIIWILAGMFALGVQASVLNIENRRFVWFISGALLYLLEGNIFLQFKVNFYKEKNSKSLWKMLIIFTVIAYVFISYNASIRFRPEIVKDDMIDKYTFNIPMNAIELESENQVAMDIQFSENDDSSDRIQILIIEVDQNEDEKVIYSRAFKAINGQIFASINPSKEAQKVMLKMKRLDSSLSSVNFQIKSVISNEHVYDLTQWYFLQPPFIRNQLVNHKLVSLEDYFPKTDLSTGLNNLFSNCLEVKSVSYKEGESINIEGKMRNQIYVTIEYSVIKKVEEDLTFYLLGFHHNLEHESSETIKFGYESFKLLEPVKASEWELGKSYKVTHVIEDNGGIFLLKAGVQMGSKGKWSHLYINETLPTRSAYLELGWLNLINK